MAFSRLCNCVTLYITVHFPCLENTFVSCRLYNGLRIFKTHAGALPIRITLGDIILRSLYRPYTSLPLNPGYGCLISCFYTGHATHRVITSASPTDRMQRQTCGGYSETNLRLRAVQWRHSAYNKLTACCKHDARSVRLTTQCAIFIGIFLSRTVVAIILSIYNLTISYHRRVERKLIFYCSSLRLKQ